MDFHRSGLASKNIKAAKHPSRDAQGTKKRQTSRWFVRKVILLSTDKLASSCHAPIHSLALTCSSSSRERIDHAGHSRRRTRRSHHPGISGVYKMAMHPLSDLSQEKESRNTTKIHQKQNSNKLARHHEDDRPGTFHLGIASPLGKSLRRSSRCTDRPPNGRRKGIFR